MLPRLLLSHRVISGVLTHCERPIAFASLLTLAIIKGFLNRFKRNTLEFGLSPLNMEEINQLCGLSQSVDPCSSDDQKCCRDQYHNCSAPDSPSCRPTWSSSYQSGRYLPNTPTLSNPWNHTVRLDCVPVLPSDMPDNQPTGPKTGKSTLPMLTRWLILASNRERKQSAHHQLSTILARLAHRLTTWFILQSLNLCCNV